MAVAVAVAGRRCGTDPLCGMAGLGIGGMLGVDVACCILLKEGMVGGMADAGQAF